MGLDWALARDHLRESICAYMDLLLITGVNVQFALTMSHIPLLKRLVSGERTEALHREIMDLE